MPPRYGGAPKCTTCGQSVFFAEQAFGPGSKVYHKLCLKCTGCSKILDSTTLLDHDGEPFCKACYSKSFGPKGYGAGGALVGDYVDRYSPSPSSSPVKRTPSKDGPPPVIAVGAGLGALASPGSRPQSPLQQQQWGNTAQGSPVSQSPRFASPALGTPSKDSNGTGGASSNPDLCRRCGTVVYFAEQVLAAGQKWHKRCLRCDGCSTTLQPGGFTEKNGLPYCKKCYSAQWGTGAQGLMSRPGLF